MFHPVITPADRATMNVHELAFFTDDPVAHAVAFRDYQRQRMIEARNADAAAAIERRARAIADFFRDASNAVARIEQPEQNA